MEVESWFVGEEHHYSNVHASLNHSHASSEVGFDIRAATTETIVQPSKILDRVYQKVGFAYKKRHSQVERTVNAIDYANLYINVRVRNSSLHQFLSLLEAAI